MDNFTFLATKYTYFLVADLVRGGENTYKDDDWINFSGALFSSIGEEKLY